MNDIGVTGMTVTQVNVVIQEIEEPVAENDDTEMDASATATDDDFGDFDLTSFPELDDLDLSDGASAGLDDLDIDI